MLGIQLPHGGLGHSALTCSWLCSPGLAGPSSWPGWGCAPPGFSGKSPHLRSFRSSAEFQGERAEAVGNSP